MTEKQTVSDYLPILRRKRDALKAKLSFIEDLIAEEAGSDLSSLMNRSLMNRPLVVELPVTPISDLRKPQCETNAASKPVTQPAVKMKPRPKPKRSGSEGSYKRLRAIAAALMNGPKSYSDITKATGIPYGSLWSLMNGHHWFDKFTDYKVSPVGGVAHKLTGAGKMANRK